jgi:hypothetical protein
LKLRRKVVTTPLRLLAVLEVGNEGCLALRFARHVRRVAD